MPLSPTSDAVKGDVSSFAKLVQAIKDSRDELFQVQIGASKGERGRFSGTSLDFDVIRASETDDDSDVDETPEEIARHIWDLAEGYNADVGVAHRFQAKLILRDADGHVESGESVVFFVGDPGSVGMLAGSTNSSDERVALAQHQNRTIVLQDKIIQQQYKNASSHLETISAMAAPLATAQVEIAKIGFDREDREYEHRERMDFQRGGFKFLEVLAEPLGVALGDLAKEWKAKADAATATDAATDPEGTELRDRFVAFLAKIEGDKRARLETFLEEDMVSVAKAMEAAPNDGAFRNQAKKFRELFIASKKPLIKIGTILGKELGTEFGGILNDATA